MIDELPGRRTILWVAQREHQLVTCFCILGELEPLLLRTGREAEVGKGGRDDVEGREVGSALGKLWEEFGHFEEAARPWER